MSAPASRMTSVSVPQRIRERLRDYQVGGKSAAQAIEDLMDEIPPDYFRRDVQRALLLPRESLEAFRRSHR
ncbi:MAG: hypothetical protein ACREB9_05005, partial [Thermoplasmata archaeon]